MKINKNNNIFHMLKDFSSLLPQTLSNFLICALRSREFHYQFNTNLIVEEINLDRPIKKQTKHLKEKGPLNVEEDHRC